MQVKTYTATVSLMVPHLVRCSSCECQYIYEAKYTGTSGEYGNRDTAEEKALEDLEKALQAQDRFDTVPCPECFRYQPYMCEKVAYENFQNLHGNGCCLLFGLAPLSFITAGIMYAVNAQPLYTIPVMALGILLVLGGLAVRNQAQRKTALYRPNEEDLEERQRLAQTLAIRPADYEQQQVERVRTAFEEHQKNPRRNSRGTPKKFVTEWYIPPTQFINGETFSIPLADDHKVEVTIPDSANPGDVITARAATPNAPTFKVRLLAMRVHPHEYKMVEDSE